MPPTLPVRVMAMLLACCAVATAESRPGVIVIQNGRVVEGEWQRQAGGYLLKRPGGEILIPEESVRVVADSLKHAYVLQRRRLTNPSPEDHIELAEWCISQNLNDEAYAELTDALYLNPEHNRARRLLVRWSQMKSQSDDAFSTPKTYRDLVPEQKAPEIESLAGFSPETAAQFTMRIQPILLNNCGNGRCHGVASNNTFRLERALGRGPAVRASVERNLAAILRYVDRDEPENSPLLTLPTGNHGGSRLSLFSGYRGADQRSELQQWVRKAVAELNGRPIGLAEQPRKLKPDQNASQKTASATEDAASPLPEATPEPVSSQDEIARKKAALVERILQQEQPDPFSPEDFNRLFGNGGSPEPEK